MSMDPNNPEHIETLRHQAEVNLSPAMYKLLCAILDERVAKVPLPSPTPPMGVTPVDFDTPPALPKKGKR